MDATAGQNAPTKWTDDQRKDMFAQRLRVQTSSGWRIESQTDYNAVLVKGRRPNHLLHLILSIITAGLWAIFVWLPLVIFGGEKRRVLSIDEYGQIRG
ncbi:MAG: hypothetical protein JJE35_10380 [Thermoleophilia bacterium]|nr:hypothetical protein [Thermoleophilia bacterium]